MSLGDEDRRRLREAVQKARELLIAELKDELEGVYGLHADGRREDASSLPALSDPKARETRDLLIRLLPPEPTKKAEAKRFTEGFEAVVRELAFTHLNRLVAFRMMEDSSRRIVRETVGKHAKSRGFLFWLADHPELQAPGKEGEAYQSFLLDRCRELHAEIGVLFDPDDLASRIFPRPRALGDVLKGLSDPELSDVWQEDETLGWTYQYYTPKELRDRARAESPSGPRNSYEMAFLNQFYTPHYVVEFLVHNTLGRLWLEMKPDSRVRDACKSLLVRPDETLPPREKKDPREIRILDPACGSGHFLLNAFDLLAKHIYPEAWDDPDLGPKLREEFESQGRFNAEVPRLIVEQNLYGIDIDRRATQIATMALFLKAKAQNKDIRIEQSGIVCAEPLPRDAAFVEAFKAKKLGGDGGTLGRIFDGLVERLALADEAGTLLQAETVVEDLVGEERKRFEERRARGGLGAQEELFGSAPEAKRRHTESFRDLLADEGWDESFFERAETEIEQLLREYAEEATGAEAAQRRMLARDSVGALRFVDAVRQRYDVVLMNPPFGAPTARSSDYVDRTYPAGKNDLSTTFAERGVALAPEGLVGVLATDAGFFRRTQEHWRRRVLLQKTEMAAFVQLGGHVLDDATVRVATFALRCTPTPDGDHEGVYLRVLGSEERQTRLAAAIAAERTGEQCTDVSRVAQKEFDAFPYAVFGYWCSEGIRRAFAKHDGVERTAAVRQGLATADDSRFLRLRWEIAEALERSQRWIPFAKGGQYSPFHDDIHLVVNWSPGRYELASNVNDQGQMRSNLRMLNETVRTYFFRPGLSYPRRTTKRFAPRIMPAGSAFADKGPAVFTDGSRYGELHALCGTMNTRAFGYVLSMGTGAVESEGGTSSNSYEVGLLLRMPLPGGILKDNELATASAKAATLCRTPDFRDETTAAFVLPFFAPPDSSLASMSNRIVSARTKDVARFAELKEIIEERVYYHYGFGEAEREEIETHVGPMHLLEAYGAKTTTKELAARIVSWAVGVVVGRFDVRLATGARTIPEPSDPFAELPARSPGMLQSDDIPDDYPIRIDRDGILVDDPGHSDDIVARVREVLLCVWKEHADALERDICSALGVKELRDYFGKAGAGGFATDTFKRYSKSKRRAPIYWLLQSRRGSYGVWLYYHRLDRDSLPKVLHENYLIGRIERCRNDIRSLRPNGEVEKKSLSKQDAKRLEELDVLLGELDQFRQDLEAVLRLTDERGQVVGYDPDLNDGVILNAAPLHQVLRWPNRKAKRAELEVVWEELRAGEYDWSHIAMHLYPERVHEKCKADASLAIAHGLDDEYFPGLRKKLAAAAAKG